MNWDATGATATELQDGPRVTRDMYESLSVGVEFHKRYLGRTEAMPRLLRGFDSLAAAGADPGPALVAAPGTIARPAQHHRAQPIWQRQCYFERRRVPLGPVSAGTLRRIESDRKLRSLLERRLAGRIVRGAGRSVTVLPLRLNGAGRRPRRVGESWGLLARVGSSSSPMAWGAIVEKMATLHGAGAQARAVARLGGLYRGPLGSRFCAPFAGDEGGFATGLRLAYHKMRRLLQTLSEIEGGEAAPGGSHVFTPSVPPLRALEGDGEFAAVELDGGQLQGVNHDYDANHP